MATKIPLEERPLADSTVTRHLTYSQYSRYSLSFNIQALQEGQRCLFWRYVCILQSKRKDLNIFNKGEFEQFFADWFNYVNEPANRKVYENLVKKFTNQFNKEQLDNLLNDASFYKEHYGESEYDSLVRYYTELVSNPETVDEELYNNFYEYLAKNTINDVKDFWPNEEECKKLWEMYNSPKAPKKENALLNSIATLLHAVEKPNRNRILAYYLIPERRIKLAEEPKLDAVSNDPYVIQPKLKRPITEDIVYDLTHSTNRYQRADRQRADQILYEWLAKGNKWKDKLHTYISLIIHLQINGIEFIEQGEFYKTFEKQIDSVLRNGLYIPPSQDDFFLAMQYHNRDKDVLLREIAVLVHEGYKFNDIYDYYNGRPVENNGIVF